MGGAAGRAGLGTALAATLVPATGIVAAVAASRRMAVEDVCMSTSTALRRLCGYPDAPQFLLIGGAATLALGLGMLALILIAKAWVGGRQDRLANVFSPLVRLALTATAATVLAQGVIAAFSVFIFEALYFERFDRRILYAVLGGAVVVSAAMARSAITAAFAAPADVSDGIRWDGRDVGDLRHALETAARRLKVEAPANVILGDQPTAWATAAPVQVEGDRAAPAGTTLHIGLPLIRVLDRAELTAVIGHELAHFAGQDCLYSLKFVPVYARLSRSLGDLVRTGERSLGAALLAAPASATTRFLLGQFALAERKVSRAREFAADRLAADAAGAKSLATALLKLSAYDDVWRRLPYERRDDPMAFADACAAAWERLDPDATLVRLLHVKTSHPYDAHPSLSERLDALGVKTASIAWADLRPATVRESA